MRIVLSAAIPVWILLAGVEARAQAPASSSQPAVSEEPGPAAAAPAPAAAAPAAETAGAPPTPVSSESPAPVVVAPTPSPAPSVDRSAIAGAIRALEEEKDETASLGGPITLLAIGGGTFVVGANLVLVGFTRNRLLEPIEGTSSTTRPGTVFLVVGGVGLVAGAGMAIGGGLWLKSRVGKRRTLNLQIDELERQLESSTAPHARVSLRLAPNVGPGAYGLSLSGAF